MNLENNNHRNFYLLKTTRFLPLFLTQFLGAFNDNVFKNALVILLTYRASHFLGIRPEISVTIAAGLFILPYFLFSALAGQLADKFERSRLVFLIKWWELSLMLIASLGFFYHHYSLLLLVLFMLGIQATFFGPLKYAILPDHLKANELVAANGFIEAGTFLAILSGTILGGLLILTPMGEQLVTAIVLTISILGIITSYFIPHAKAPSPHLKLKWDFITETISIVRDASKQWDIYLTILGISWFWLIGGTYLAQFSIFAKNILHANEHVVILFFTIFSVGIGLGSLSCQKLLKGKIVATYVPLAALGITIFSLDLVFSSQHIVYQASGTYLGVLEFLQHWNSWRISLDLLLISICGGLYIVPLYTILQVRSDVKERARIIAVNNIFNALLMTMAALFSGIMLGFNFSINTVFLIVALLNIFVAIYMCKLLPEKNIKAMVKWLLTSLYRVEVKALENYQAVSHSPLIIIVNHASFIDSALLSSFLPEKLTFAVNTQRAKNWSMRLISHFIKIFTIDPTKRLAMKSLIKYVENHPRCVIYPEGRMTVSGALMKLYEVPGLIADKTKAKILPIRIEGAQYSPFSKLRGRVRLRWFPKITLTILPALNIEVPENYKGRKRRQFIGHQLYSTMLDMVFSSSPYQQSLPQALFDAIKIHGRRHKIIEDIERKPLTYQKLLMRSMILGRRISFDTALKENVGILLPNSNTFVLAFFGVHFFGRTPVILNYSSGSRYITTACLTAKVSCVYTARQLVQIAKLEPTIEQLIEEGVKIVYLEDLRTQINIFDKLIGLLYSFIPRIIYLRYLSSAQEGKTQDSPERTAAILFTSGSEGIPKGVVLSHRNVLANCYQMSVGVDFTARDIAFNALPVFHSFGLTAGLILPLLNGIKTFLYPSPLHFRIIPRLVYEVGATIFYGTDTFLTGYEKYAHPYDFYSIRYTFVGAEKLKEENRQVWAKKFGVSLLEGYGATEASPVICMNTLLQNKFGTVGKILPGIHYRLEKIEGHPSLKLWVKGPNIMLGYLRHEHPGILQVLPDGWYDTGDLVSIDEQGYVTIIGRVKRFAKIAGEMISLGSIEEFLAREFSESLHAVISIPDNKKGEQIILFSTEKELTRETIVKAYRKEDLPSVGVPKQVFIIDSIPLLGNGKIDYQTLKIIAEEKLTT